MEKFFLQSKTIIGAIILVLGALGITLPISNEEVSHVLVVLQDLVGFILVIVGRIKATKPLGWVPRK